MHSGINRRLLTATTPEFLSSLVTPSRRVTLQAAVPGAVHPAGGLKALTTMGLIPAVEVEFPADVNDISSSVNQQGMAAATQASSAGPLARHSTARRALQGSEAVGGDASQAQQQEGSQLAFYALPAWASQSDMDAGRQLLFKPAGGERRRMMEGAVDVYHRHM
jgi:hypothetical protein